MKTPARLLCLAFSLLIITGAKYTWEEKFNIKSIEKAMMKISDSLYACEYETPNLQYRTFLNELKAANKNDDYKIAEVDTEGWCKKYPYAYNDPLTKTYFWHPAYYYYPVVNMKYEGAVLFCNWLTEKYNSWKGRKFKKVRFWLPTGTEWEFAARGGLKEKNYPWGNSLQTREKKYGWRFKYMCNYRPVGDERIKAVADTSKDLYGVMNTFEVKKDNIGVSFTDDGGTYTVKIWAYDPNGYGLYNMSGNVAEMVSEKGIVRGGSWANTGYDVRIKAERKFENSSPEIGFRYFMEVIEK